MKSILSTLSLASSVDGIAPATHTYVVLGESTESGWPIQRGIDSSVLLMVDEESIARNLCHLLNTVANFITHGALSDDHLAFITGIDAAWDVEMALHALGLSLSVEE